MNRSRETGRVEKQPVGLKSPYNPGQYTGGRALGRTINFRGFM